MPSKLNNKVSDVAATPTSPLLNLRPGVAQCNSPVEDEIALARVVIHTEIAEALELKPILRPG